MTYTETGLAARVAAQLDGAAAGGQLTPEDIGLLDQYHAGGVAAVDKLIAGLGLRPGNTVVDVGCGLGGPARRVAEQTGAGVIGVDITEAYVDLASMLTSRMELDDRVSFRHADIKNFEVDSPFDAAITMHVSMNIADKAEWFAAIAAVLAPGARLAIWEVCANTAGHDPTWPMPWSLDGTDSYLVTGDELKAAVESAGLHTIEWQDETPWVAKWAATLGGSPPPVADLVLPMLLEDGFARVGNLGAALTDGALRVVRGLFHTPHAG